MIDLEKQVIQKGNDESLGHGFLAKPDRFHNHLYFKKDGFLYCFGEQYLHRFDLRLNKWDTDQAYFINNSC